MSPKKKLIEQVKALMWKRGQNALEIAKQAIAQENIQFSPLREALDYFMKEIWEDVLHPALLSLACEAAGGNPNSTIHIGAAIVLLAGGADVHDDIIDQSVTKDSKPTVFGKFGRDIAILTGDALLFQGLYMLHDACEEMPKNQKQLIRTLTKQAFFQVSSAEAKEASFRGNLNLTAEEYLEVIKMKIAVSELATKIGAVLANGTQETIETLGHFGKTIGLLMTVRDEFVDVFELDEIKNRYEKECLPLPVLSAFQDKGKKDRIIKLLQKDKMTQREVDAILELVMKANGPQQLKENMRSLVNKEMEQISSLKDCKSIFELLLWSPLEDL